jgi:hypothetical protein
MTLYRELRESGAEEARELVTVERRGGRAIVTMDEPERLNPLSVGLNLQLQERLSELAADPAVRAIVLTGADPAFSTGGDLEMMATGNRAIRDPGAPADTTDAWRWIRHQFGGVARLIATTDKLFVAALNGPAAGVGLPGRARHATPPGSSRYGSRSSPRQTAFPRPRSGMQPSRCSRQTGQGDARRRSRARGRALPVSNSITARRRPWRRRSLRSVVGRLQRPPAIPARSLASAAGRRSGAGTA